MEQHQNQPSFCVHSQVWIAFGAYGLEYKWMYYVFKIKLKIRKGYKLQIMLYN